MEMQQQLKSPEDSGAASKDKGEPAKAKTDKQKEPAQNSGGASDTEWLLQHGDGVPQEQRSPANTGSDVTDAASPSRPAQLHDGDDKDA